MNQVHSFWFRSSVLAVALLSTSCDFLRAEYVLNRLNEPSKSKGTAPKIDVATRVARLTRDSLADAYIEPGKVATYMNALGSDPAPLESLASCLAGKPPMGGYGRCYDRFIGGVVVAGKWGIPAAPSNVDVANLSATEIDAERFLANVMTLGPSLAALQQAIGAPIVSADLETGIRSGANDAAAYISARKWRRQLGRPSTALALSGGAANGAFSAGAIWRLFEILDSCRGVAKGGCGDARIDLVAGTSTGALIGVIVDRYFADKAEDAKKLLIDNYTCTVESDLYCVNSAWIWNLAEETRGIVKFDGIHDRLDKALTPELDNNATELVTVSVDYASGDIYAMSDQDPVDSGPRDSSAGSRTHHEGRLNAVMASIVEPVLAEPVDWLPSRGGVVKGTFIDGGIRSGLPVLQAMQRGAERVLVFSNSGIEPDRIADPSNAVDILMRSLDLMVGQPRVTEVQQAEFGAVARRLAEYNVCQSRFGHAKASDPTSAATIDNFCARTGKGFSSAPVLRAAASAWVAPVQFPQVATSWRSAWVYRPEKTQLESASGYSFTPEVMRPLFEAGVATFQERCDELLDLLEIRGRIAENACREPVAAVVDRAKNNYTPVDLCTDKPNRRTCP